MRRPQKFEKISHFFWTYKVASSKLGDFFKFLWPSQSIWILINVIPWLEELKYQLKQMIRMYEETSGSSIFSWYVHCTVLPLVLGLEVRNTACLSLFLMPGRFSNKNRLWCSIAPWAGLWVALGLMGGGFDLVHSSCQRW